jgi:hypothetical protein
LDNTERNSFILSIIVNVESNIFAVALLKTDSIDMEIIERSEEKKQQREVNDVKDLNKMSWSQTLPNGTGFCWGIRSLSLVGKIIGCPSVVYECYEIESHILTSLSSNFCTIAVDRLIGINN